MEFKQSTIADIVESEHLMVLSAPERYGSYYDHAIESSLLFSRFVKSISPKRSVFTAFLSYIKKHHLLAVFSTVRLHKVQAMMDLRHVLEAGAAAAFAIAHPQESEFVVSDEEGLLISPDNLKKKRYAWLDKNYPEGSRFILEMKRAINESTAHANLIYASSNFGVESNGRRFTAPFFDNEDEFLVAADLWMCSRIAIGLIDLFVGVNSTEDAVKLADDFNSRFSGLLKQNKQLNEAAKASQRYREIEARQSSHG